MEAEFDCTITVASISSLRLNHEKQESYDECCFIFDLGPHVNFIKRLDFGGNI